MTPRRWVIVCSLAVFLAASSLIHLKSRRESTQERGGPVEMAVVPEPSLHPPPSGSKPRASSNRDAFDESVIRVNPTNVLASVNGREIRLADLVPLNPTHAAQEQEFAATTYKYLLERAVNRELTFQAAKAQGLELDESQRQQLSQYRGQRKLREPGLVQQLSLDDYQIDFEVRDAQAFMLQTALLDKAGASPNVSAQEAKAYYDQHVAEFGALPADEPARSQAWADIDYQIRTRLAPAKRAQFQGQLTAYMDQIRSGANIAMSPAP